MIKRTIEISSGATYLSVKNEQLVIRRDREVVGTVPCEDIGILIVDHPAVTYTHGLLTSLARVGAVLIACAADHHPQTYVLPVHANTLHTERLRLQVEQPARAASVSGDKSSGPRSAPKPTCSDPTTKSIESF